MATMAISLDSKSGRERAGGLVDFCQQLKVFANPRRFDIMLALVDEEMSVSEIERHTGIKQPNLSLELRKLRDKGMVVARRQSKVIFYSIASDDTRELVINLARQAGVNGGNGKMSHGKPIESEHQPQTRQLPMVRRGECAHFPAVHQPHII